MEVPTIAPRDEDVASIDGVIKAFYEVISGPAGQARQWSRDRTLYIPDVRFVAMSEDKSGKPRAQIVSHQQFVDESNAIIVKDGFYESEIHRVTAKIRPHRPRLQHLRNPSKSGRTGHRPRHQQYRALLRWKALVDCL